MAIMDGNNHLQPDYNARRKVPPGPTEEELRRWYEEDRAARSADLEKSRQASRSKQRSANNMTAGEYYRVNADRIKAENENRGQGVGKGGSFAEPLKLGRYINLNDPETMPHSRQLYLNKRFDVMNPNIMGYGGISMEEQFAGDSLRMGHDTAMYNANHAARHADPNSQQYFDHVVSPGGDPTQYKDFQNIWDGRWYGKPVQYDTAYPSYIQGQVERASAEAEDERKLNDAYQAYLKANGMY